MTCIAAITDGKTVWVGGDSAGVAGSSLEIRADEKVFTRKDKNKTTKSGFLIFMWHFGLRMFFLLI